jgi:hypothetical protein
MLHLFSLSSVHIIKELVLGFVIKSMKLSPLSQWDQSNLQFEVYVLHGIGNYVFAMVLLSLCTYDPKNYPQYLGLLSLGHNDSQGTPSKRLMFYMGFTTMCTLWCLFLMCLIV